jgi:lipopolysaccharide export system permease protein
MLEIRRTLQLPFQGTREELQKYARQLRKEAQDLTLPIRVHMHHQVAYSFACIGFALIGIPLGIQAHRRETSIGVAIALVLVLVYYGFVILAQSLSKNPSAAPHLLVWAPNFLFQLTGGALLWRLHRRVG